MTTVSHVLNEVPHAQVRAETRQRVIDAADRLGYRPNRMARSLRTRRTGTIGLIGDSIATTPYAGKMILGAQRAAQDRGYTVVLFNSEADPEVEQRELQALLDYQVDGILYATMYHREVTVPELLGDLPVVLLDAVDVDGRTPGVVPDEVGGGHTATEGLTSLGHRRIGFLTNVDDVPATHGRLQGYRQALEAAGIAFDPSLVIADESETWGGHRAARTLLSREDRPTAIFAYNDRMAMGAYRAAGELGLRIPDDVSVIGFDDQEIITTGLHPELTSVALPHFEMGYWAGETLIGLLDDGAVVPEPIRMPCPIRHRASTAALSEQASPRRHENGGVSEMRPRFHFTAESGWINDPHGLTFHDGAYHLFHQFVPDSLDWAPSCHWGHAVGSDLMTWERRPVAIAPGDDEDGIWTGSLVRDESGDARIFYTSVVQPDLGLGRVRAARPKDATWEEWVKGDVVVEPPLGLDLIAYRDPFVVPEGEGWRLFIGAADGAGTAMALTYVSPDLARWEYDGVAAARSTTETDPWLGALWECPQFFEIGGHWVMVSSVWSDDVLHYAGYGIGTFAGGRFEARTWGQLSFGESYYAPSFFRDREGRPCLIFWMRGVLDADAGWCGALSLPYVLSLVGDRLVAQPHPDVAAHRTGIDAEGGHAFDLEWTPTDSGDRIVLAAAGSENAVIEVDHGRVRLERLGHENIEMPWSGGTLRVVVDGPTIEISSPDGLLGGPIEPVVEWLPTRGAVQAWRLG
jgi:beta-fructofuranosidase